jgi:hypothetical protein
MLIRRSDTAEAGVNQLAGMKIAAAWKFAVLPKR